jgi:Xaa-Pro aminopeptidase
VTPEDLPAFDYASRRAAVLDRLGSGVAVFRAPPVPVHANDVEGRYRPPSDFHYLTGFPEADAVAVLDGSADTERFVLFVQPRDKERETWTGRRVGVGGAIEEFGADAAYPMDELDSRLVSMVSRGGPLHYQLGRDDAFDRRLLDLARSGWAARPRTSVGTSGHSVLDPGPIVHEMRMRKSPAEVAWLRHAIEIAAEAHREAMRVARPGMSEHEIEALVEYVFRSRGASGWAYPTIAAAGANATVLHYTANNDRLADGQLLLLDAGDECGWYCADITRTFPIGADFTAAQRRVHDLVCRAQAASIARVRPGATLEEVHEAAVETLVDGLLSLGLLEGTVPQVISDGDYRRFYMHRTSHWLGMDVHDVGAYSVDGRPRVLEPGMILTVEPGLYFALDLEGIPDAYRGIGVRIEDDVLVTPDAGEILSTGVPRSADEVLAHRARA